MTRTPRAVIVGAGLMGRWHAQALVRAGGRVVAVVDVDEAAAAQLARDYPESLAATAIDALPTMMAADIVHVCTPAATHAEVIRRAIARRCPVIVEKPLAPDAAETERLLADAARAGVWLVPVHQTLCQDGVRRALTWSTGRTLRLFDYCTCSAGAADASPSRADAVAAEILPHPLSLIDAFRPGALEAITWTVHRPAPGELAATGAAGALIVRLLVSMHARPTRHDLTISSDSGTIDVDLFHGHAWREPGARPSRATKVARPFAVAVVGAAAAAANLTRRVLTREPAYPGLSAFIAAAYRSLDDPAQRPVTDAHTRTVARARDAILRQAGRG
jgi:predicted dehydrogenase